MEVLSYYQMLPRFKTLCFGFLALWFYYLSAELPPLANTLLSSNSVCYSQNVVVQRSDHIYLTQPVLRNYSLIDFKIRAPRPCESSTQLILAINEGYYSTENGTFVMSCQIPEQRYLPKVCVRNYGDSLTRHMLITVSMIQSDNFVSGGHSPPKVACLCDGQYSEHPECRRGLKLPRFICTKEAKQIFWFQGGLHDNANSTLFLAHRVTPVLEKLWRPGDTILITGMHRQTTEADLRYPLQNESRARSFNDDMKIFANSIGGLFIDFMSLTAGQLDYTSDGVHFLTSVNLVKAQVFLALLNFEEKNNTVP